MTHSVLIVEDASSLAASYAETLARVGIDSDIVDGVELARGKLKANRYDAVLLDLFLPDGDGLSVLRDLNDRTNAPNVIAATSDGSIARAVEATRLGAFDFIVKPVSRARLTQAVQAALRAAPGGGDTIASDDTFGIRGSSPQIIGLRRRIRRVAQSGATVFITGESGVGKELCAQAVHAASSRSAGPFIALNCGAIPGDLLESEMFGHLKGSFTGAISDKLGAVGAANGGTLFLDEICEMDVHLQTKLLRFLETATITPVGATSPRHIDVRIICATNRNPKVETEAGRFREDLYYRLVVLPVHVPPLRDRGADVLEIADALLAQFAKEEGKSFERFDDDARRALLAESWPGNVRQLRNVVRQAVVMEDGGTISAAALMLAPAPDPTRSGLQDHALALAMPVTAQTKADPPTAATTTPEDAAQMLCRLPMLEIERLVIDAAIETFGSAPKAARSLKVSPSTIYRKKEIWDSRAAADRSQL